MKYGRTYNFSAGPAMMPEPVLEEIRDEMMNYRGSGMCVMEMSHRSKVYQQIIDDAEKDLRDLMGIPDNYKVLFIQGGATLQFSMIPMNLMKNGKAVYIETGAWSKKAIAEAKKCGEVIVAASSKDKNYTYVPDCSDLDIPEDTDYVYICENETIHGVTYNKLPNTKGHILVSDQSSMFKGTVEKEFRSLMNVPFVTESKELDAEVVAATKAAGYDNLKGHKSVGGLRASIYNAMPKDGVEALVEFLKKFEEEHK